MTVKLKGYNIMINKETRGVKRAAAHCAGGPQVQRAGERGGDIIRILEFESTQVHCETSQIAAAVKEEAA